MGLKVDFSQLRSAVDWSTRQMASPRQKRVDAVLQYVGNHYAQNGSDNRVPTNFIELACTIYVRLLAANSPRVLVTSSAPSLRSFAYTTELALNQIPEEIDLAGTLRRAVLEALFSMGVVKVGLCASGTTHLGHDTGKPYVDIVSLDDYFCDMSAKSRSTMQFEGNDYWMTLDAAREMFGKGLMPDDHTVSGSQGEERAEGVSVGPGADLYKERVWLRDVYLHATQQIVTYSVMGKNLLRVKDWEGPEGGPYHVLGFSDVPGNLLPLPPVALWLDLHELGNLVFRKLARQADAKKTVAAFQGGNDEAVTALKNANDGDGIRYDGQKPEMITVGGIDTQALAFYLQIQDLFDYFAGNINTLGGLSPSADTVGQDRLLSDAAGARAQDMAQQTIKFAKGIFKALAWYEWNDPLGKRVVDKPIPSTDLTLPREWSDSTREGKFEDYDFEIDVYSMQDNSPSTKLQKLGLLMQNYLIPLMPVIQQQGGSIDVKAIIEQVAGLSNMPELADVVKFQNGMNQMQPPMGGGQEQSAIPSNTTRTYERVNRPGATRSGKNAALAQVLMGGNPQPAEAEQIGRRVS